MPFFNAANGNAQGDLSLRAWRDGARLGERITYHIGNLARDRGSARASATTKRTLAVTAADAWHLYLSGRARLLQRRLNESAFAYIAVATQSAANADYTACAVERSWQSRERTTRTPQGGVPRAPLSP